MIIIKKIYGCNNSRPETSFGLSMACPILIVFMKHRNTALESYVPKSFGTLKILHAVKIDMSKNVSV